MKLYASFLAFRDNFNRFLSSYNFFINQVYQQPGFRKLKTNATLIYILQTDTLLTK